MARRVRRGVPPSRRLLLAAAVVALVIVVVVVFGQDGSHNEHSSIEHYDEHASEYRGAAVNASSSSCAALSARSDVDVVTDARFGSLNFDSESVELRGEFWNDAMQKRYEQRRSQAWPKLPLSVIVVPHSHNDPGWLKTFEQYFASDTARILDNMVDKMMKYPDLTFVWSEMSYLQLWYESAHPRRRENLLKLLASRRLEILTAGWVMTDEANTHLYSMLDQLIEGQQWAKVTLNYSAKSSWSVDAFGHSSTMPFLLKSSLVQNLVVVRIHYAWKEFFARQQLGDFKWVQPWDKEGKHDLLVHNHPYDIYSVKSSCGPHPQICLSFNFGHIPGSQTEYASHYTPITPSNLKERSELLLEQYGKTGSLYPHNVVLVPLGDDFTYGSASEVDDQYTNYKNMFDYINENKDNYAAEVRFGTVSDYFDEVRRRMRRFETLSGDFFVYSDVFSEGRPAYWSGYFTTRPFLKRLSRQLESQLRAAELLLTLAMSRVIGNDKEFTKTQEEDKLGDVESLYFDQLVSARRNLALFQHHDGITGTSKMFVMDDYGQRLFNALQQAQTIHKRLMPLLMRSTNTKLEPNLRSNNYALLPQHVKIGKETQTVWVFNSLAQTVIDVVQVEMNALEGVDALCVVSKGMKRRRVQVSPVWSMGSGQFRVDPSVWQLSFVAELNPLSISVFRIESCPSKRRRPITKLFCLKCPSSSNPLFSISPLPASHSIELENKLLKLSLDPQTRQLTKLTRKTSLTDPFDLRIKFGAYATSAFRNGAYLFKQDERANISGQEFFSSQDLQEVLIVSGSVLSQVTLGLATPPNHRQRSAYLAHTLRIYHSGNNLLDGAVSISNLFDFGDSDLSNDKDFFMRLSTTDLKDKKGVFYTDNNGFQMMRRTTVEQLGLEANQYPISSQAFIQDDHNRLTMLVDHAQSANSFNKEMNENTLELIVDRKAYFDDSRGMGEGLTDSRPTLHNYVLLLETITDDLQMHDVQLCSEMATMWSRRLNYESLVYIADSSELIPSHSWLKRGLDAEVHLLNLRTMTLHCSKQDRLCGQALLLLHRQTSDCRVRNGNIDQVDVDAIQVDEKGLFDEFGGALGAKSLQRTSLTGVELLKDIHSNHSIDPMTVEAVLVTF